MPVAPFPFNHLMGHPVMIRKGERGSSSELLNQEQPARIDRYMQAELRRYGCDFPYTEMFETVDVAEAVPRAPVT
jgi:hypothetical protein